MPLHGILVALGAGLVRGWAPAETPASWGQDLCFHTKAGLGDRKNYYIQYGGVAAAMNATLYIPARPCDAFRYDIHGLGGAKDCNRTWSKVFALPPMIRPAPCPKGGILVLRQWDTCPGQANKKANCPEKDAWASIWAFYKKHREEFPAPAPRVSYSCDEYKAVISDSPTYMMYHIRRGDLIRNPKFHLHQMNIWATSVANVTAAYKRDYATHPGLKLFYMTDETDPTYLAALEASLAKINPSVARADRQFPGCNEDNFCVYCNAVQMKSHASHQEKFGCHGPKCYK